jgi:hypothetical protein
MNAVLVIISNNGQAIVVIYREAVEIIFFLHHTVQSALDLDVVVRGKHRPLLTAVIMPLILPMECEDNMSTGR